MAFEILAVKGLSKRYGDVAALSECNVDVRAGQLLGFLGPNGAGKTTTMRAILGVITTDSGSITWNGEPVGFHHRKRIGYLPQERGLYPRMRAHEQVVYFGRLAGLEPAEASRRASEWLERVDLDDRADSMVQELSVGNQQRVQLAVALVHEPELLVLDEPFAGLDPVGVAAMQTILRERAEAGSGVVFSSHQLDLVQDLCRDVTIIAGGRTIASGTVEDLRADAPQRYCTVTFGASASAEAFATKASERVLGSRVMQVDGPHATIEVSNDAVPTTLMELADAAGEVRSFVFEPPGLEDLFLDMVDQAGR